MVVLITNLTDVAGHPKGPTQVDVHNRTLSPGEQLKLPADLVNKKVRDLETGGLIAIGNLPPWYAAAKRRITGRPLSEEERAKRQVAPPPPVIQLKTKDAPKQLDAEEPISRKSTKG